ncbi:MAG: flippase activity-associated protein Agl23 [archaeon]
MPVTEDESTTRTALLDRVVRPDRVSLSVLAVAFVALVARLVSLGTRVASFGEGRLGYRILQYRATGDWAFAPAGGSPLLVHVDRWLFAVAGPDDFVARLPVAVVGACLPLVALLFHDRLRDGAVVGVAVVLAASPALVFHSRALSPAVPMAAFSLAAAGFALRLVDRGDPRNAYALAASVALAIAADESAIAVLAAGLPSAWLVVGRSWVPSPESIRDDWKQWRRPIAGSIGLLLALVTLLFAPRGSAGDPTALWAGLVRPWHFPGVMLDATVGTAASTIEHWGSGPVLVDAPIDALAGSPRTVLVGAQGVAVLAVVGVLWSRRRFERHRHRDALVRFATLWGVLLFAGAALTVGPVSIRPFVPAIVVLAVPAGVGLAALVTRAVDALRRDSVASSALLAIVLGAVVLQGVAVTVDGVYRDPAGGEYPLAPADAGDERLGAVLDLAVRGVRDAPEGPDVLYYGSLANASGDADSGTAEASGHPLPWYFGAADATVEETTDADRVATELPPVVVARAEHFETLEPHLEGYVAFPVTLPRHDGRVVVFLRTDRVPSDRWTAALSAGPAGS